MPPAHGAHAPNPRAYGIYRPPADWRPEILQQQNKFDIQGQALHSLSLTLIHPRTNQEMTFTAPIPQDMQKLLKYFRQTI